jgi:hypothetical protein
MVKEPTGGEKAIAMVVGLVVAVVFFAVVLDRAGIVHLSMPHGGSTATSTAAPGKHKPTKTQAPAKGKYKIEIRPGANLPGRPITDFTMAYLEKVAGIYGGDLVVSYGTAGNHVEHSFHYSGHAADIGMGNNGSHDDSDVGDRIMRACLIAMGMDDAEATRIGKKGALIHRDVPGMTVECIWKVADHHDHVHIAASPR